VDQIGITGDSNDDDVPTSPVQAAPEPGLDRVLVDHMIAALQSEVAWLRERQTVKDQALLDLVSRVADLLPRSQVGSSERLDSSVSLRERSGGNAASVWCPAGGLYLDLMKKCLTRMLFAADQVAGRGGRAITWDPTARTEGLDWPADAETMIGMKRLDNIEFCVTDVLRRGIPGDLIETGVWRGGATIFMRAILKAYGDPGRTVWVADSFAGVPEPDPDQFPADAGDPHHTFTFLAVPLEEVQANFARYELLDNQVRFLVGWFRDTLPSAPIDRLAVLRLDGDMYESTIIALRALYPRLSIGGYVIVDDFGAVPGARKAVEDFRIEHEIDEPIVQIDYCGVYWQRLR
jgi:hypothetical protein